MENTKVNNSLGGNNVAVNDRVEIISRSYDNLYGVIGKVIDIKGDQFGTDIRIQNNDGLDVWIDASDVVIC